MDTPRRPHPVDSERPVTAGHRAIAWVDGRIMPASDATVPLMDDGFLRGDAVFEAVLVRAGRTHALEAHLSRMRRSARALGLRLPVLRHVVADLLAAWGERDGLIKVIVTRDGTVRGIASSSTWPASIALAVIETPWRSPLSGVKTLSYAVNQWLIRQAVAMEADDALIVDDGQVLELPTGAVCLVHGDAVTTPDPTRLPILDSVTVQTLREVVDVAAGTPTLDDLRTADELFVVSATRPVLSVHSVVIGDDQMTFPAPGRLTEQVGDAFAAHIDRCLDPLP